MPLFLLMIGNTTLAISYELRKYQRTSSRFPYSCTDSDTAQESGRSLRGSNVYELNAWLRQFGRGKPRVGGPISVSVADTEDRRIAVLP
jgi:hypothetical protein